MMLDVAATASTWSAISGCAETTLAAAAAIIEPDPTPAPIANARGSKMLKDVASDAIRLISTAPNRVPKTYIDRTPRYWSESGP